MALLVLFPSFAWSTALYYTGFTLPIAIDWHHEISSSYISSGMSLNKLFCFYRRHRLSDITTRRRSATGIQWPQKCTFFKISVFGYTKWIDRKPLWPRGDDARMLNINEFGLLNALQVYAHTSSRHLFRMYGERAYPLLPHLQRNRPGPSLSKPD